MHRGNRALRAWLGVASAALLSVVFAAVTPTLGAAQPSGTSWPDRAEGFGRTATGGAGGQVVTVNTQAALEQAVSGDTPRIVRVDGTITIRPFGREIPVGSNKTVIGVGTRGTIAEGGLLIINQRNVIIRNLTIRDSNVASDPCGDNNDFDGIQVDTSRDIWIDHNHVTNPGDGIMDIRKDTDNITVSWNILSRGCKAMGVGWTPNVITKITVHHNWFRDNRSRNPVIDNVVAGHVYNNYWRNISGYGVLGRGAAKVVVEGNYFQDAKNPYGPDSGHPNAQVVARDNILVNVSGRQETRGPAFNPSSYYSYQLDPASQVPNLVTSFAGPQANIGVGDPPPTSPPPNGRDAFSKIEAESYNAQSGTQTEPTSDTGGGLNVGWINNGDWLAFHRVDFGNGARSVDFRIASNTNGGNIEARLGGVNGTLVSTCPILGTGGWQSWQTKTCPVSGASGVHDLYLRSTGGSGYLFNVNWMQWHR